MGKLESYWMKNSIPELIIGHKSMAEIITYHTQVDVLPWQVEYEVEDDKLYRIAYLPFDRLYEYYLHEKPYQLAVNYYYIKESDWQLFLTNLKKHENAAMYELHQNWKNPHEIRPAYLLKN